LGVDDDDDDTGRGKPLRADFFFSSSTDFLGPSPPKNGNLLSNILIKEAPLARVMGIIPGDGVKKPHAEAASPHTVNNMAIILIFIQEPTPQSYPTRLIPAPHTAGGPPGKLVETKQDNRRQHTTEMMHPSSAPFLAATVPQRSYLKP